MDTFSENVDVSELKLIVFEILHCVLINSSTKMNLEKFNKYLRWYYLIYFM
jgi:hypothetical protein